MKKKTVLLSSVLAIGLTAGAIVNTPIGGKAATDLVLASVDWVNGQINPLKTRLSSLETVNTTQQTEINKLKTEITNLKAQINNGAGGGGNTESPSTTTVYVSKSSVKIHSGASTSYKVLATKTLGNSLKVIDTFTGASGLWYRVEISSTVKGWIYSGDVTSTAPASPTKVVTTAAVTIRSGASTSYKSVASAAKNSTLSYLSSFTNASGETWYNVKTSTGVKGWMLSTFGEVK